MKQQLCWDCQNARADRCCWMRDGVAVQGWDAEECPAQKVVDDHGEYTSHKSYYIKGCPNFVPDEQVETVKTGRPSGTGKITKLLDAIEKIAEQQQKFKIKRGK